MSKKKPFYFARWLLAAFFLAAAPLAIAVEIAPRISDREIIESLAELKAGQKALEARMDQRFKTVDQRFEAVDQQFDRLWALMLIMIAGIFGLIGYIVWDRKTALRPVDQESEINHATRTPNLQRCA